MILVDSTPCSVMKHVDQLVVSTIFSQLNWVAPIAAASYHQDGDEGEENSSA